MKRHESTFQIGYSIRLETMHAVFLARVDRFVNFSQLLLGAAVITTTYPVATGIAVAALGAFSFVYQPGSKSTQAIAQKQKYEKLQARIPELGDDELFKCVTELQEGDSLALGSLKMPAYVSELVCRGAEVPTDCRLSLLEKTLAFIAGDLPKSSDFKRPETS